jgi:proteasome lid subunit RPN8/RPN11
MKNKPLLISIRNWISLIRELRRRGYGERESGAFLLAKQGSNEITKFICYDELDPTALDTGIIVFHGAGFVPLWDYCRKSGMSVVADVHTHSDKWTGQSEADRTHPMIGQKGHVSLIVPHYAQRNLLSHRGVGIYEYAGNHQWLCGSRGKLKLTLFSCPN